MRFVVAQNGARRGYAVPALLARAGMLERFYTDVAGNVGWGRWIAAAAYIPGFRNRLSSLAGRMVPPEVKPCCRPLVGPHLTQFWTGLFDGFGQAERFRHSVERSKQLSHKAARKGFGKATHLYTMLTEFPELMFAARRQGIKVVSEIYITISTERMLAEERRWFPNWEPEAADLEAVRREFLSPDPLFEAVDYYLCPSGVVAEDLVTNWGIRRERTLVVPYGVNRTWLETESQPTPGRILFVGTADLRKGIHYLALAAAQLRERGADFEFRVAGQVTDRVRRQPECRHLNFLGRIPRDRIQKEFQTADVFVLPTLAEGSAEVTYEALASGLPVITTRAAGSMVHDGIEGCIVPERDAVVLASTIQEIVSDRQRRGGMALAARELAREFTWERYGERLIAALQGICA